MKVIIITLSIISLLLLAGCSSNQGVSFDECEQDLLCFSESFNTWNRHIGQDVSASCGLGLILNQSQMFIEGSNSKYILSYVNYCMTEEEQLKLRNEVNTTIVFLPFFESVMEQQGDSMRTKKFKVYPENYNLAQCFYKVLFEEDSEGHDKYEDYNKEQLLKICGYAEGDEE